MKELDKLIEEKGLDTIKQYLNDYERFEYLDKGFHNVKNRFNLTEQETFNVIESFLSNKKDNLNPSTNGFLTGGLYEKTDFFSLSKTLNITDPNLIHFIKDNLLGLKHICLSKHTIYYNDHNEIIFCCNEKDCIFINSDLVWSVIENKFHYKTYLISDLIGSILKQEYNLDFKHIFQKIPKDIENAYLLEKLNIENIYQKEYFYDNLMFLKSVELSDFPNYIMYFNNEGKNIFQYNKISKILFSNYNFLSSKYEREFRIEFGYDIDDFENLIKGIGETVYKLDIMTAKSKLYLFYDSVEVIYKDILSTRIKE